MATHVRHSAGSLGIHQKYLSGRGDAATYHHRQARDVSGRVILSAYVRLGGWHQYNVVDIPGTCVWLWGQGDW